MDIDEKDIRCCLEQFGIQRPLKKWALLADGPDHPVPYDVIRKIFFTEVEGDIRYVIKFIREPVFPTKLIEQQSCFSDLLRKNGIATPFRMKKDGHYCVSYEKDSQVMDVTVEEWMGEKIAHITPDFLREVGSLLGKTHRISLNSGMRIGFSLLYNEILTRDTSYARLWKESNHEIMPAAAYEKIVDLYNQRLAIVKRAWSSLPRAAVQGDIYSCNNLAWKDGRLALYDFNLAGDEVLIGDILQCWFRTIFDERMEEDMKQYLREELWDAFIGAYQNERPLTGIEKQYFPDAYSLFGVLYFTKLLAFQVRDGRKEEAVQNYEYLFRLLEVQKVREISYPSCAFKNWMRSFVLDSRIATNL
ncbi:MAG: hypothetical protein LUG93_01245 [Lachnospiraceae bacterium]|nr:hypothetical protein [Lachnospiraceae bacterium]